MFLQVQKHILRTDRRINATRNSPDLNRKDQSNLGADDRPDGVHTTPWTHRGRLGARL